MKKIYNRDVVSLLHFNLNRPNHRNQMRMIQQMFPALIQAPEGHLVVECDFAGQENRTIGGKTINDTQIYPHRLASVYCAQPVEKQTIQAGSCTGNGRTNRQGRDRSAEHQGGKRRMTKKLNHPDSPPKDSNSVLLRMQNGAFAYWAIGQYNHENKVWRYAHPLGYASELFPSPVFIVLGWCEIICEEEKEL